MQKSSEFATIAELAEREVIAPSYMTRVLRLTLLASDIIEAVLNGKQGLEVTLARLLESFRIAPCLMNPEVSQRRPIL
jgi:DNA-binding IscR family transcriptional regulator